MYDLIAKVPAADFDFLEYDFVEFWARRNVMMMNITNLKELKLEFNMDDLKGDYEFEIDFRDAYGGYVDGKYVTDPNPFKGSSPIEEEIVKVKASEDAFATAFKNKYGTEWGSLAGLYNDTMGNGDVAYYPGSKDTLGAAYFNSTYETLQLTTYLDCLTEQEQEAGLANDPILTMRFRVEGKKYFYTYEFRRIDDRRIMVSLFRSDADGNRVDDLGVVSDFYISTFAFKKIVNQYIYLLNGKEIGENINYN
jgi:hypothetical protein